jgi:hypothetical protein
LIGLFTAIIPYAVAKQVSKAHIAFGYVISLSVYNAVLKDIRLSDESVGQYQFFHSPYVGFTVLSIPQLIINSVLSDDNEHAPAWGQPCRGDRRKQNKFFE